ncbi:MAG: F0F1 ATP synthase subunit delta, partial [Actinobacteria bacterium]|nr:F0F1 ATP synthase subunit delta [Actinomycetota bacterium]NIS36803.1 F0F1 ATP synthase subunit delta [Actinomycetota bacterium]NIT99049.1 F0F1 ATP synthase subunit delta [Actinomycetota bacterium]NIU22665.1 F0F1 ATP synthase subunit delta [Actinomycetota bacterium]NIU71291.1 F0F1 ATP synthase subunit delta [Actinomycetota bacterium]
MADDRLGGYADALLSVAAAEGASAVVEDELFRVGEALRENDQLLSALGDKHLPIDRRMGVVEELLGS